MILRTFLYFLLPSAFALAYNSLRWKKTRTTIRRFIFAMVNSNSFLK